MATITDCTISGNSASDGGGLESVGGVFNNGAVTITDCTISGNSAQNGGGVTLVGGAFSRATIGDTIVAGNAATSALDVSGVVTTDEGYNLIGDGDGASGFTAAGDQVGTAASPIDPMLAPLGDYGGPTQTMPLRVGSPAIGKGVAIAGITTDGSAGSHSIRPGPDIGAFQDQSANRQLDQRRDHLAARRP